MTWLQQPEARWQAAGLPRALVVHTDLQREQLLRQEQPNERLLARLQQQTSTTFNLSLGPAGRVDIWQLNTSTWAVAETFPHVLADGRSLSLLHEAVYADYLDPAREYRPSPSYARVLAAAAARVGSDCYWRESFSGFDTPIAGRSTCDEGADWTMRLGSPQATRIERAAGRLRGTLASALLAAHAHAIARHSGTGDIATYLTIDTRTAEDLDVFGQMTTAVPLRIRHNWAAGVGTHVTTVTRAMLVLQQHAGTASDEHVPVSLADPNATAFVMQPYATAPCLPGMATSVIPLRGADQAGGLATVARPQRDGSLQLSLRAAPGSCLGGMIASIGDTMKATLETIASRPETPLGSDKLLPRSSRELIRATATPSAPYPYRRVSEDSASRLASLGSREVLVADQPYLADDMLRRMRKMAQCMRDAGTREGDLVMVGGLPLADRIAAFAAALDLGAIYLPFDADPPNLACEAGDRSATLVTIGSIRRCPGPRVTPRGTGPEAPAYVIHTSGSSGVPKGVVVSRSALSNLACGDMQRFGISADSRVLLIAPPVTDPWICHVATALMSGATLVACQAVSGPPLAEQIRASEITHAFLPAALVRTLGTHDLPSLQVIASAGDTCLAADLVGFSSTRVFNIYGPTEATVTATVAEVTDPADPIPIGRPIRGMGARVVIDRAATAPLGAPGELVLSGAGVADGYLGDDGHTNAAFRPDPFMSGQRWYCTGDLVCLKPDGQLIHLGRADRQVKIRGFRVELEALEVAARATGLCVDARARAYRLPSSPDMLLVLFAERCPDTDALRRALGRLLPHVAMPHHITPVPDLPRHPSGKVADAHLPPDYAAATGRVPALSPTASVGIVAGIWAELLGTRPVPGDHFFDVGGDSLMVLRLVRLARDIGISLDPADVYDHPEFSDLDQLCRRRRRRARTTSGTSQDRLPLGPTQQWLLGMSPADLRAWTQSHIVDFDQMPCPDRLSRVLSDILYATPVLRTSLSPQHDHLAVIPAQAAHVDVVEAAASDSELRQIIAELGNAIDPAAGVMMRAAAIKGDGASGVLLLIAHHLVVDTWSWPVIEDRLKLRLSGDPISPDHGFAQFAEAVARQVSAGAFDVDIEPWKRILAAGDTVDLARRPAATSRVERVIAAPENLARRWSAPASRVLLAALGDGLHAASGSGATVIDLERNGRASIAELDLAGAAGWIALHHPLALHHRPLDLGAIEHIREATDEIPDSGLGYGALRWSGRASLGDRVARFAVNIDGLATSNDQAHPTARRVESLLIPPKTSRDLPYHGTFTFLHSRQDAVLRLDFDPAQVCPDLAEALLDATVSATQDRNPGPARKAAAGLRSPLAYGPVPASAMQRLMLHYAGSLPGAYLPRQVLTIDRISDPDRFLSAISTFLGELDPFRRRFQADGARIIMTWLPGTQAVPVARAVGGRQAALAWVDSADRITTASVLRGEPAAGLTAFSEGSTLFLGMEAHHALLDGVSNAHLLTLIGQFARRFPAGPPGIAAYRQLASRTVTRKHVACELAVGEMNEAPRDAAPLATLPPVRMATEMTAACIRRVSEWASRHGTDLRAALAAAVALAASGICEAPALHVVANGRDPDISGSADALGMFWYFQRVGITSSEPARLAEAVYRAAAEPLKSVRSAAQRWPQWDAGGVTFNFIKQDPDPRGGPMPRVIASRDTFHFATQIEACLRPDRSVLVTVTAARDQANPQPLCSKVGELVSRLADDWRAAGRGRPRLSVTGGAGATDRRAAMPGTPGPAGPCRREGS